MLIDLSSAMYPFGPIEIGNLVLSGSLDHEKSFPFISGHEIIQDFLEKIADKPDGVRLQRGSCTEAFVGLEQDIEIGVEWILED